MASRTLAGRRLGRPRHQSPRHHPHRLRRHLRLRLLRVRPHPLLPRVAARPERPAPRGPPAHVVRRHRHGRPLQL